MVNSSFDRLVQVPRLRDALQNRLLLAGMLLLLQVQFFTINFLNARLRAPTEGWELIIPLIDHNLIPNGYWLIPYSAGFVLAALVPLWAMFVMPNTEYRQFVFGMTIAAVVGYVIYIIFPTYVTKPMPEAVPGDGFFANTLRASYEVDAKTSTHNAAPSQHVFYAILNACFMIRFRPRMRTFWFWTTLAALISASALLTMRHNSPDIILGYVTAAGSYYAGVWMGARVTHALGDAHTAIRLPHWIPTWLPRWMAGVPRLPRQTQDFDMRVS